MNNWLLPCLLSLALCAERSWSCVAEEPYEKPPTLSASQILEPKKLRSPLHQVAEEVKSNGYLNTYQINSPFGSFTAYGDYLLRERILEIKALAELRRITSSNAFSHAEQTVKTRAASNGESNGARLGDPRSAASMQGDESENHGDGVAQVFSAAAGLNERPAGPDAGTTLQETSPREGSSAELRWYRKLAVAPSSDNQILRGEISRIAQVETVLGIESRFMPMVSASVVDEIKSQRTRAEQMMIYDDPEKSRIEQEQFLASIKVSPQTSSAFFRNPYISPAARAIFLSSLKALKGVNDRHLLVEAIALVKSRQAAIYYARSSTALMNVHFQEPLVKIVAAFKLPAAISSKGKVSIPLAVDYLVWTREIATIFDSFKARVTTEQAASSGEVLIAGLASQRCRGELEARGALVRERVAM